MVRRILANESSTESESDELKQNTNVFKEQATAISSRANSPSDPPAPLPSPSLRVAGVVRTPRSERIQKK